MASPRISPPEPFDFSCPDQWPRWLRCFQRYRVASGLATGEEETQVNTLIYCMGDKADDILRSFRRSATDEKKYDVVCDKFSGHFVARRNVIYEQAKFNSRRQEPGESADTFITALFNLAEHCGYEGLHDQMVRDRIVIGILDRRLSERLQLDADLTQEKTITSVRQAEEVKKQQTVIHGVEHREETHSDCPIQAVHNKPQQSQCPWCGKSPHDQRKCPARSVVCHKCSKKGHFQAVCRSQPHTRSVHLEEDETEIDTFLGELSSEVTTPSWIISLQINGKPTDMLIDTGAEVTVISEQTHRAVGSPPLSTPTRRLKGPTNQALPVIGFYKGMLSYGMRKTSQDIYVVKALHTQLLGRPAIETLGLVVRAQTILTHSQNPTDDFPKLFQGLGKLNYSYTIKLSPDAMPYAQSVVRRVAIPLLQPVKDELERMEQLGVIARVEQPTDWCAGLVVRSP